MKNEHLVGVVEESGTAAADTSVRAGAPIARCEIISLLEKIADQKRRYQSVVLSIEQADVFASLLRSAAAIDDGYPLPIDQHGECDVKLDVSKEWYTEAAQREGDSEIGAGSPYGALLPLIDKSIDLLLLKDGDRDHMNHSDITCEQSMAIVEVLRRCRLYFL